MPKSVAFLLLALLVGTPIAADAAPPQERPISFLRDALHAFLTVFPDREIVPPSKSGVMVDPNGIPEPAPPTQDQPTPADAPKTE